jgi:hypothetical protein
MGGRDRHPPAVNQPFQQLQLNWPGPAQQRAEELEMAKARLLRGFGIFVSKVMSGQDGPARVAEMIRGFGKNVLYLEEAPKHPLPVAEFRLFLANILKIEESVASKEQPWRYIVARVPDGWKLFSGLPTFNEACFHFEKLQRTLKAPSGVKQMLQIFLDGLEVEARQVGMFRRTKKQQEHRKNQDDDPRLAYVPFMVSPSMPLLPKTEVSFRLDRDTDEMMAWKAGRFTTFLTGDLPAHQVFCAGWDLFGSNFDPEHPSDPRVEEERRELEQMQSSGTQYATTGTLAPKPAVPQHS